MWCIFFPRNISNQYQAQKVLAHAARALKLFGLGYLTLIGDFGIVDFGYDIIYEVQSLEISDLHA